MKHLDKALVAAGAALVLSGGVAYAALGPGDGGARIISALPGGMTLLAEHGPIGGPGFLVAAATYIGISESDLRTQLQSGKTLAEIAVANGKTRDGLIAALSADATARITTLVDTKNPLPPERPGKGGRFGGDEASTVTSYLGIGAADIRTQLQSGKTLAQIANATAGKSADGLVQALVAAETKEIDDAVAAGKMTADQATQRKASLAQRFTAMVNATRPAGPGGFAHRDFGR